MNHIDQLRPSMASAPHLDALEGQIGLRLAGRLSFAAEALPHDISARLRFSREHAVAQAVAQRRTASVPSSAVAWSGHSGGSASLSGPPSVWLRLASAFPLVVLAAGLVLIQHHHDLQQIAVAAEIDSALLADDLPPTAYGDPGFTEFLRSAETP